MKKRFNESKTESNKWYEEFPKGEEPCKHSRSETEVSSLKDEAKRYLNGETSMFQLKESKSNDSETAWLKTALSRGTTSDKVAAAIVLVQDNPKYNLARLTMLINQVKVVKHNQCSMIIKSLKDLFLSDLLHPEFKLLKFEEQNLDALDESKSSGDTPVVQSDASRKKLMAHWYFEDQLREHYERFVMSLAAIASDTVDANRELAIATMTELLIGNAEQEHKLLELIVNKIGDPSSRIGSKVIFCLNKLLHEHPNMKLIVLREVEKLLFRKNVAQRAQYYAICLLTQFVLNRDDEKIASTLVEVYFAFFKACLKKGEPDSRMMAAILTGVNRAYPFAKVDSSILNDHVESVYKVVHVGSFNVSLNALNLLYQITGNNKDKVRSSRFYSAFYRKLLDPQVVATNKRALFFNLLFRVLKNDHDTARLYAFIKRSLQITLYFPANMACATLYVISKVLHTHKELETLLLKPQDCVRRPRDIDEDSESINNSMKSENSSCDESITKDTILLTNVVTAPKYVANEDTKSGIESENDTNVDIQKEYDPFCRNPTYAGISKHLNTELTALSKHYHPSVALFANTLLEGKSIDYTGDPLEDLSLMRFLDRYVFKNPKKLEEKRVHRKNKDDPLARRAGYTPKGVRRIPVDSASYLDEKEDRIPVDELYLYRYLKRRKEFKRLCKTEDDDDDDDDDDLESVNSEEFNDMLDRLTDGKDFEDLDIAGDIQTGGSNRKGTEEEDENEDEDLENGSDRSEASNDLDAIHDSGDNLEENDEMDADLENLSDLDDDTSDLDFYDDLEDDEDILDGGIQSSIKRQMAKINQKGNKKNRTKGIDDDNVFVSAEKFAEMLEEHGKQKYKSGGTNAVNTADGASFKQIEWEMKRNQRIKGPFGRSSSSSSSSSKRRKGQKMFKNNIKKTKR